MNSEEMDLATAVLLLARVEEEALVEPIKVSVEAVSGKRDPLGDGPYNILTIVAKYVPDEDLGDHYIRSLRLQIAAGEEAIGAMKRELSAAEKEHGAKG